MTTFRTLLDTNNLLISENSNNESSIYIKNADNTKFGIRKDQYYTGLMSNKLYAPGDEYKYDTLSLGYYDVRRVQMVPMTTLKVISDPNRTKLTLTPIASGGNLNMGRYYYKFAYIDEYGNHTNSSDYEEVYTTANNSSINIVYIIEPYVLEKSPRKFNIYRTNVEDSVFRLIAQLNINPTINYTDTIADISNPYDNIESFPNFDFNNDTKALNFNASLLEIINNRDERILISPLATRYGPFVNDIITKSVDVVAGEIEHYRINLMQPPVTDLPIESINKWTISISYSPSVGLPPGTYIYKFSYYTTYGETSLSQPLSITTTNDSRMVNIVPNVREYTEFNAKSNNTILGINYYRTKINGNTFYKAGNTPLTNLFYDTVPDSSLVNLAPSGQSAHLITYNSFTKFNNNFTTGLDKYTSTVQSNTFNINITKVGDIVNITVLPPDNAILSNLAISLFPNMAAKYYPKKNMSTFIRYYDNNLSSFVQGMAFVSTIGYIRLSASINDFTPFNGTINFDPITFSYNN